MAINFPNPAGQTPVNTFSPTSTPAATTNGLTYTYNSSVGVWTATAAAAPVISPATSAEAVAGTITTAYSSPATAVPKNAAGMTGAALIPGGVDANRPLTPVTGMLRFNSTSSPAEMEFYNGTQWSTFLAGGGTTSLSAANAGAVSVVYSGKYAAFGVSGGIETNDGQIFITYYNSGTGALSVTSGAAKSMTLNNVVISTLVVTTGSEEVNLNGASVRTITGGGSTIKGIYGTGAMSYCGIGAAPNFTTISTGIAICGWAYDMTGNALNAATVNHILTSAYNCNYNTNGNPTGATRFINLSGGTSAGISQLTTAGAAARAALVGIGWTITLNP